VILFLSFYFYQCPFWTCTATRNMSKRTTQISAPIELKDKKKIHTFEICDNSKYCQDFNTYLLLCLPSLPPHSFITECLHFSCTKCVGGCVTLRYSHSTFYKNQFHNLLFFGLKTSSNSKFNTFNKKYPCEV
jgi:hypothetical protein